MIKLRLYFRLLRLLAVIGLGALLAGVISVAERIVKHDLMSTRQRLTRWFMARLSAALPFRVRVSGRLPETPMMWVSNHISWTDIPLLGMLAPLSFLSKAEVRSWPVAGWLAQKAGTLFIRRGAGDSTVLNQQLSRHLQQSRNLLMFPEGTTTDGQAVRTFHGRLLSSAIDSSVALQPVAIRYLRNGKRDEIAPFIGDDDMLSHLLRLFRSDRAEVEIQLLTPIASHDLNRNALARQAQTAITAALFGSNLAPATSDSELEAA